MIWWHCSNGSKELHLPLTISEISDIIFRLRELHILINVIIIGGDKVYMNNPHSMQELKENIKK
jgi:MoaA/NifB/PqqE/SkfB family radical SAM enzyme